MNAISSAISANPVASELASSAIAMLPPASRSPMMPEPTTAASSSAVPTASAAADLIQLLDRQGEKEIDASRQRGKRILEGVALLLVGSFYRSRIRHAPVRLDRMARPDRADLGGRRVAYRDDEIDLRRTGPRKFVPALRARCGSRQPAFAQQFERKWIDAAGWMTAGAVSNEAAAAGVVEISLGEDRPRRVAGAEKQHRLHLSQQAVATLAGAAAVRLS